MHLSTNIDRPEVEDALNFLAGSFSDLESNLETEETNRGYPALEQEL